MPLGEVAARLDQAWGKNWHTGFSRFNFTPMAAASIGQVHEAVTRDGRRLAVKIQYPGICESIDSDVDNAARLLALLGAAPGDGELAPVLHEAKRQLHQEADYLGEARRLIAYADLLGDDTRFQVPEVDHQRTTQEVLVMSYVPGGPLETLERAGPADRHAIATRLVELSLREVFEWGLVQTDPNFSNYRYDEPNSVIGLLDFGAACTYPSSRTSILRRLLCAGVNNDPPAIEQAAMEAGYLGAGDPAAYRKTVVSLLMDATEPARHSGKYDFASCGLPDRMREKVVELRFGQRLWRLPPLDLLLLHRKLGGLYMLCARLRARVPVQQLIKPYLA